LETHNQNRNSLFEEFDSKGKGFVCEEDKYMKKRCWAKFSFTFKQGISIFKVSPLEIESRE